MDISNKGYADARHSTKGTDMLCSIILNVMVDFEHRINGKYSYCLIV